MGMVIIVGASRASNLLAGFAECGVLQRLQLTAQRLPELIGHRVRDVVEADLTTIDGVSRASRRRGGGARTMTP